MRRVDVDERRSRLGIRHHLARPVGSVDRAACDMVGLHSSDPASVFLSAKARVEPFKAEDLEEALYDRRSLVRMLGMRRTLFVAPLDVAAVMEVACTKTLAPGERRRLAGMLEEQSIAESGEEWIDRVTQRVLERLARGEATATELTQAVPELGARLSFGEGKTWATTVGASTRLLFLLATEGRIVRARPLGRWTSSRYRWAATETWLEGRMPEVADDRAPAELLRRWLSAFGPGTSTDIRWWTGWTARRTEAALSDLRAVEVELDEGTGYLLPDDLEPSERPEPWVALLPGLDPTVMGWKQRDWYLGRHAPELFDRNGNAGPTVWCDGRVVGGWAQTLDGDVAVKLLESVDSEMETMIDAEAIELTRWLGEVRVKPRSRTPLERALAG